MSTQAPVFDPDQRDPAQILPTDAYQRGDLVWVYRGGAWHPGVIEGASPAAVIVTYQPVGTRGTMVDTVAAESLTRREESGAAGGER